MVTCLISQDELLCRSVFGFKKVEAELPKTSFGIDSTCFLIWEIWLEVVGFYRIALVLFRGIVVALDFEPQRVSLVAHFAR